MKHVYLSLIVLTRFRFPLIFFKTETTSPDIHSTIQTLTDGHFPHREEFKLWEGLGEEVVSRELTVRARPLAFVANPETDTELWVYRNPDQRDLIFAFRCRSCHLHHPSTPPWPSANTYKHTHARMLSCCACLSKPNHTQNALVCTFLLLLSCKRKHERRL